jgi:hypothetical protein
LPEAHALDLHLIKLGETIEHAPDRAIAADVLGVDGTHEPIGGTRQRLAPVLLPETEALLRSADKGGKIALGYLQLQPQEASTNRRSRQATYPAVCCKRATLLGNVDRANRKPQCERN